MNIKLLSRKEIKEEFKTIIKDALLIKSSVAFWNWDDNYIDKNFGEGFFKALRNPDSYICVDISTTITNIDDILKCSNKADNFFVFSYKFKKVPIGVSLLHSKVTYIENKDYHNIIIGSHNNTKAAFDGKNLEHSILIKFSKKLNHDEKEILDKTLSELDKIKDLCLKFNKKIYKDNKFNKTISLFLRFNPQQIGKIQKDSTISIISFITPRNKNDAYKNIYNKETLLFIKDSETNNVKVYLAIGEADDKVGQGEMDEKVTSSDFVAIRIAGTLDRYGLPYPFIPLQDKTIKGSIINFRPHMIQRIKIIRELSYNEIYLKDDIIKSENIYKEIDLNDVKKLGVDESEKEKIVKIDIKKYEDKSLVVPDKINTFDINDIFISNTNPKTEKDIYNKFEDILTLLFNVSIEENNKMGKKIDDRNNAKLREILEILADEKSIKLNYQLDNSMSDDNIQKLQAVINDYINNNVNDKNNNNKLGQFESNFVLKK